MFDICEKCNFVEPWNNPTPFNMIRNKQFGGGFSTEAEAVVWLKRDGETFRGGCEGVDKRHVDHRPLVCSDKSFDTSGPGHCFWSFSIKQRPFPSPFPQFPCSVYFWESCQSRATQGELETTKPCGSLGEEGGVSSARRWAPALTHWLLYLMWNPKRSAQPRQLLPQQNNKTPLVSVSPSLSLVPADATNNFWARLALFDFSIFLLFFFSF